MSAYGWLNPVRFAARRLLWGSLGRCGECGKLLDYGELVLRPLERAAIRHFVMHNAHVSLVAGPREG